MVATYHVIFVNNNNSCSGNRYNITAANNDYYYVPKVYHVPDKVLRHLQSSSHSAMATTLRGVRYCRPIVQMRKLRLSQKKQWAQSHALRRE